MLKKIVAIGLLALMISSSLSQFFLYAGFELNRKYITENLCVNRDRPWMHCNGRCYLMRKLKDAQEKEKKQELANRKIQHQEALQANMSPMLCGFGLGNQKLSYPRYRAQKIIQRSYTILIPPKIT